MPVERASGERFSPRAIGIATAQRRALAKFVQQLGNHGSVERHYLIPNVIS